MLSATLRALTHLMSHRDNEFDNAEPGPSRPMTGLFHHLTEKKKQMVLTYKGAEYTGGPIKKTAA